MCKQCSRYLTHHDAGQLEGWRWACRSVLLPSLLLPPLPSPLLPSSPPLSFPPPLPSPLLPSSPPFIAALVKYKLGESVPVPQVTYFSRKKSKSSKQHPLSEDEEEEEEEEDGRQGRGVFRICPDCDHLLKK